MASDARELRCGRDIGQFAKAVTKLREILERFLDALSCIEACFVSEDVLDNLALPSQVGAQRVGGIDMNRVRMRKVARALLALSAQPFGFTCAQLAGHVQGQNSIDGTRYDLRQAAYDLQKFRGKRFVGHFAASSRRYQVLPYGLRALSALLLVRDQVIAPLLASTQNPTPPCVEAEATPLDRLDQQLRGNMREVLSHLGFAA
jgi:hypothetical protein